MGIFDGNLLQPLVGALGWTLVHFLWQGCVIAFVYWLICAFSREQSAYLRYWSGLTAYFISAACLLFTFKSYYRPPAEFALEPMAAIPSNAFLVLSGKWPDIWPALHGGVEPMLPLLVALWLMGVGWMSVKAFCDWVGTRRLLVSGVLSIDDSLDEVVRRLSDQMAVKQAVRVIQSSVARVPMVVGFLRPVILLPVSSIAGLPREQLEMVLAHELGHIKRFDYLFNLFQVMLETLLFFHPAIGWMGRRIRHEREMCCDDLVVTAIGRRVIYAKALANVAALSRPSPSLVIAASGGNLVQRVGRIVNRELKRDPSAYVRMMLLGVVALVVAVSSQQGIVVQRALEGLALSVQVQGSDYEYALRSQSREAWSQGISQVTTFTPESEPDPEPAPVQPVPVIPPKRIAQVTLEHLPEPPKAQAAEWKWGEADRIALEALPPKSLPPLTVEHAPMPVYTAVRTVQPLYPWTARRDGVEGFVQLEFSLDPRGRVRDIAVVDAKPKQVFDKSAIKALRRWRFDTESLPPDGKRISKTFDFQLDGASALSSRYCPTTGRRTCSMTRPSTLVYFVNPPTAHAVD